MNPFWLSHGLSNRLAQTDANIFHGVMVIDMKITLCFNGKVHAAMMGKKTEHVIEKGDARIDPIPARPVQVKF
jgi:hypothetical protein